MVKKVLFLSLLVGLFLAGGLLYAAGVPEVNYTWTKIGDNPFFVCDLNGLLFLENTENYNNQMIAKFGETFRSWEEAKKNRIRLGLKSATVKYLTKTGEIATMENKVFYTKIKYGNNQELAVKVIRDRDKVQIFKEENAETPVVYRSQNSNYHVFTDEEGIWGIQPILTSPVSFQVTKLTQDLVNGKNRAEIQAELGEDKALSWNGDPQISPKGDYVAYVSNKGGQGYQLWLVDIKQETDQNLNTPYKTIQLYDWADDNTIVYSLDEDYYLYDVKNSLNKQLLKDIRLLNFNQDIFVYTKETDDQQIYFYRHSINKEVALSRVPDIALYDTIFSRDVFSLSSDNTKLLLLASKDSDSPKIEKMIYLINSDTSFISEIKFPETEEPYSLGPWTGDNKVVIYTKSQDYPSHYTTWILNF